MCAQQGRRHYDARSVLIVRECERREERQVCEPEGSAKGRERRWRIFSTFPVSKQGIEGKQDQGSSNEQRLPTMKSRGNTQ